MKSTPQMLPADFKAWRKEMNFSQAKAATALGYGKTMIYYFEKGAQDIPLHVAFACAAIVAGLAPYKEKTPA